MSNVEYPAAHTGYPRIESIGAPESEDHQPPVALLWGDGEVTRYDFVDEAYDDLLTTRRNAWEAMARLQREIAGLHTQLAAHHTHVKNCEMVLDALASHL